MLGTKKKQPVEVIDYPIDFSLWLPEGDVITTAETSVEPEGELVVASVQVSSPFVNVWVRGGVDGGVYKVTLTTATSGGRVKQEEFKIRVKEY